MPESEPTPTPQVHRNTRAFREASFHYVDVSGAIFRDCDMRGVRIVSSFVDGLVVSGFSGRSGPVVVDDVDVSEYVAAELDRRHPERVRLREARTADDLRAVWADLERLWDETLARAGRLPEETLQERVHDEWSFVETLRHLAFAVDTWIERMAARESRRRSPRWACRRPTWRRRSGRRSGSTPRPAPPSPRRRPSSPTAGSWCGQPSTEATDAQLDEPRTGTPVPAWGEETHDVGECLRVVLEEHIEHRRFAERDLAALTTR